MNTFKSTLLLVTLTVFLIFIGELDGGSSGFGSLFSTHPPIKERITRLIGRDHV